MLLAPRWGLRNPGRRTGVTGPARRVTTADRPDHIDANYRHVRRPADLGGYPTMSAAVHASDCVPVLLSFLRYGVDALPSERQGSLLPAAVVIARAPVKSASSATDTTSDLSPANCRGTAGACGSTFIWA